MGNEGNWRNIESQPRKIAEKLPSGVKLSVITGTLGILKYNDEEVYLYKDQEGNESIPIPETLFKIVQYQSTNPAYKLPPTEVYVMPNNPFRLESTNDMLKDVVISKEKIQAALINEVTIESKAKQVEEANEKVRQATEAMNAEQSKEAKLVKKEEVLKLKKVAKEAEKETKKLQEERSKQLEEFAELENIEKSLNDKDKASAYNKFREDTLDGAKQKIKNTYKNAVEVPGKGYAVKFPMRDFFAALEGSSKFNQVMDPAVKLGFDKKEIGNYDDETYTDVIVLIDNENEQ